MHNLSLGCLATSRCSGPSFWATWLSGNYLVSAPSWLELRRLGLAGFAVPSEAVHYGCYFERSSELGRWLDCG